MIAFSDFAFSFWGGALAMIPPSLILFKILLTKITHTKGQLQEALTENRVLQVHLEKNQEQFEAKIGFLAQSREETEKNLKALCGDALQANNRSFLDLAQTVLEKFQTTTQGTWSQQQQAMTELMTPLAKSLETVDQKIQDLEKTRIGAYEGLRQQIGDMILTQKELRSQTMNLTNALRSPHVRGRWGEIQLRRVVEMAGMLAYCDFEEQVETSKDPEKRQRPDLIVKLPGGRQIVVDAKVPLSSYLEGIETQDEQMRQEKMKDHARQVRSHVKILSNRHYWEQFQPSPEFVLLFLPGEVFFSAALEQDPQLLEYGVDAQVILATPTTLIALLRAIAFGWRQEKLTENAQVISTLGRDLYKRLSDMGQHFTQLGRQLGGAVNAYNQAVGSLEHRVFPTARRFKELGSVSEEQEELPSLQPLNHQARDLNAIEWSADPMGQENISPVKLSSSR